jgi:hypothetical protein
MFVLLKGQARDFGLSLYPLLLAGEGGRLSDRVRAEIGLRFSAMSLESGFEFQNCVTNKRDPLYVTALTRS